jgi:hypothetical protein
LKPNHQGLYLTAGDGPNTDFARTWFDFYDAAFPDSPLFLGAEACQWGVGSWAYNADSIIWPRLSVLAEKLWSPAQKFLPNDISCGKQDRCFNGQQLQQSYKNRLIMQGCSMLRRGVAGTPVDNRDHFGRRSPWFHCEIGFPPKPAAER